MDDSLPTLDLKVMNGGSGFYERILSDPDFKGALQADNFPEPLGCVIIPKQ